MAQPQISGLVHNCAFSNLEKGLQADRKHRSLFAQRQQVVSLLSSLGRETNYVNGVAIKSAPKSLLTKAIPRLEAELEAQRSSRQVSA